MLSSISANARNSDFYTYLKNQTNNPPKKTLKRNKQKIPKPNKPQTPKKQTREALRMNYKNLFKKVKKHY